MRQLRRYGIGQRFELESNFAVQIGSAFLCRKDCYLGAMPNDVQLVGENFLAKV